VGSEKEFLGTSDFTMEGQRGMSLLWGVKRGADKVVSPWFGCEIRGYWGMNEAV
jgi:hypothetical protein